MNIDISLPKGWKDLSQSQIRFIYRLIGSGKSSEYIKVSCFLRWSGLKFIGRPKKGVLLLRKEKLIFEVSIGVYTGALESLEWLLQIPDYPVVIDKLGRHKAIDKIFHGVSLDDYLTALQLWSLYLDNRSDKIICDLVNLLYGCDLSAKKIPTEYRACTVYWFTSLQSVMTKSFPSLFEKQKNPDGSGNLGGGSSMRVDYVNAILRSLTKGDILKEDAVLAVDTWRALTELDAIARENNNIKQSMKKYEKN